MSAKPIVLHCAVCKRDYNLEQYVCLPLPKTVQVPGRDQTYYPPDPNDASSPVGAREGVMLWRDCACGNTHAIELVTSA